MSSTGNLNWFDWSAATGAAGASHNKYFAGGYWNDDDDFDWDDFHDDDSDWDDFYAGSFSGNAGQYWGTGGNWMPGCAWGCHNFGNAGNWQGWNQGSQNVGNAWNTRWLTGSGKDDHLQGTQYADLLDGGAGDDALEGLAGDDVLYGGQGNDILKGGAGNDVFVWTPGTGIDSIVETAKDAGIDTLVIKGAPVLYVTQMGADLQLGAGNGQWAIVDNYFQDPGLEFVRIGDKTFTTTQIASLAEELPQNQAGIPEVSDLAELTPINFYSPMLIGVKGIDLDDIYNGLAEDLVD